MRPFQSAFFIPGFREPSAKKGCYTIGQGARLFVSKVIFQQTTPTKIICQHSEAKNEATNKSSCLKGEAKDG